MEWFGVLLLMADHTLSPRPCLVEKVFFLEPPPGWFRLDFIPSLTNVEPYGSVFLVLRLPRVLGLGPWSNIYINLDCLTFHPHNIYILESLLVINMDSLAGNHIIRWLSSWKTKMLSYSFFFILFCFLFFLVLSPTIPWTFTFMWLSLHDSLATKELQTRRKIIIDDGWPLYVGKPKKQSVRFRPLVKTILRLLIY